MLSQSLEKRTHFHFKICWTNALLRQSHREIVQRNIDLLPFYLVEFESNGRNVELSCFLLSENERKKISPAQYKHALQRLDRTKWDIPSFPLNIEHQKNTNIIKYVWCGHNPGGENLCNVTMKKTSSNLWDTCSISYGDEITPYGRKLLTVLTCFTCFDIF